MMAAKYLKHWGIRTFMVFMALCFMLIPSACGGGDDDGSRMGELIVGTWQRGWDEGDVIIEGDTNWRPEDFSWDLFIFRGDGTFNGMVRSGSFSLIDYFGDIIYEGTYRCDNSNLKLEYLDEQGVKRTILAQVMTFTNDTVLIKYVNEDYGITVTITLRKKQDQSSSTSAA